MKIESMPHLNILPIDAAIMAELGDEIKKPCFMCMYGTDIYGTIYWHPDVKMWVFESTNGMVYNLGFINDIKEFMEKLNVKAKEELN